MALLAILAAGYGLAVNLLAFALFGIDKRRAVAGAWRIPEATLIRVALAGGWLGAKAGQRRFRHKTSKQPFARRLNGVGLLHLGVPIVLASVSLSPSADLGARFERMALAIGRGWPVLVEEGRSRDGAAPLRPVARRPDSGSEGGGARPPTLRPRPRPP